LQDSQLGGGRQEAVELHVAYPVSAIFFPQAGLFYSIHFTESGKAGRRQRFRQWNGM
jgi:hypothetical protein